jgi:hypothetical protein
MTTNNYTDFLFSHNGINYISRISETSPFIGKLRAMPAEAVVKLNQMCLDEYLTEKTYTLAQIQDVLDKLNDGGTHAFIMLGENN